MISGDDVCGKDSRYYGRYKDRKDWSEAHGLTRITLRCERPARLKNGVDETSSVGSSIHPQFHRIYAQRGRVLI